MTLNSNLVGAFLPTSDVYDTQIIQSLDVNSQEFKDFLIRLRQSVNNVAIMVNYKDSGMYSLTEFVNGQTFFPNPTLLSTTPNRAVGRQVFRLVVNFGALPNNASKSVAHGIDLTDFTANFSMTRLYATASDTTAFTYIPIPYASPTALANNIEISVDSVNVTITTGSDRTNFDVCYAVLEYIKE